MSWIILLCGIVSNALASVLLKLAVTAPRKFPSLSDIGAIFTNWPFWLGLGLYGAAFVLYAAALERLPLNVAHPVLTVGAVALVAIFSFVFFHETFQWTTIVGIVLVAVGVVFIAIKVS